MPRSDGVELSGAPADLARDIWRSRARRVIGDEWIGVCPDIEVAADLPGGDAAVQAIAGLMALHGRDDDRPRRLGLEAPSVAAGIVGSQAALAAALGRLRGVHVATVHTSLVAGALAFLHHHLAIETCGQDLPFAQPRPSPGPPFRTSDGHLVEIEALLGKNWTEFWVALGVDDGVAGDAWLPFVFRFLTSRCALPHALHDAMSRRRYDEVLETARSTRISASRVRSYEEILHESSEDECGTPVVDGALAFSGAVPATSAPPIETPLAGIRVVEVTSRLQGPLAALLLRQLGASVIKVEPPGGDFGRKSVPRAGTVGAAYLAYNRRKERLELDYKEPSDRARLIDLVREADVFVQNWPDGRAEALGLDAPALARVNPALVYVHASGWNRGRTAPRAIASDYVVQAHAALGDGIYPLGETARPSRLTLVDAMGGLLACEGILAGLYRRELSRRGQRVETSLYGAAMSLQAHVLAAMRERREAGRVEGRPQWTVLDQPLAASDGFIFAGPLTDETRGDMAQACGLRGRVDPEAIAARIQEHPCDHWIAALSALEIPVVRVRRNLRDLPDDPLIAPWVERESDSCWVPSAPWRFSA